MSAPRVDDMDRPQGCATMPHAETPPHARSCVGRRVTGHARCVTVPFNIASIHRRDGCGCCNMRPYTRTYTGTVRSPTRVNTTPRILGQIASVSLTGVTETHGDEEGEGKGTVHTVDGRCTCHVMAEIRYAAVSCTRTQGHKSMLSCFQGKLSGHVKVSSCRLH
ncbi:hypothetical protein BC826DRAFT_1025285 [Russula brevipes]|nr:hypothetical protein BC826DRAFT_1025285 [Russula brevipes]